MTCGTDAECCTNFCDPDSARCSRVPGECVAANGACQSGPDCCSFACVNGACAGDQCTSDNESCTVGSECCGGSCDNGTCTPLNSECRTSGNSCSVNGDCCSKYCKDGTCNNAPSFCLQTGDTCTTNAECCGGSCNIATGATLGTCVVTPTSGGVPGCDVAGLLCGEGTDYMGGALPTCGGSCCSRACFPYGPSGALICQPPSGCTPTGDLCTEDSDCCGGPGNPDSTANVRCSKAPGQTVGRCDNGNACSPAGAICRLQSVQCNANANCCAGNVLQNDTCAQDNLGIPRCLTAEVDCTANPPAPGTPCATSADCCGLPCTEGANGMLVCSGACIAEGGGCTTSADCCAGQCTNNVCGPPGMCAEYGQDCTVNEDCCNNQPCNDGKCGTIIL